MEWTERIPVSSGGVTRSIQHEAEDGHVIVADLVAPMGPATGPTVMVTCQPVVFDDGAPQLERFPTMSELAFAADELAPLCMYATMLPTFPPGERMPPPPGARSIPLQYMGAFTPPGRIEVVGSIPHAG